MPQGRGLLRTGGVRRGHVESSEAVNGVNPFDAHSRALYARVGLVGGAAASAPAPASGDAQTQANRVITSKLHNGVRVWATLPLNPPDRTTLHETFHRSTDTGQLPTVCLPAPETKRPTKIGHTRRQN